jgi:hypothetical protein
MTWVRSRTLIPASGRSAFDNSRGPAGSPMRSRSTRGVNLAARPAGWLCQSVGERIAAAAPPAASTASSTCCAVRLATSAVIASRFSGTPRAVAAAAACFGWSQCSRTQPSTAW